MVKSGSASVTKTAASKTDNNPMYRVVARELRPLQEAAENMHSSRWTVIKERAERSGVFTTKK
ncbi:hypothetical protein [Agrobacterium tumefaciens]|uniref:hypothetical protein n=1 Tax=Agrobacterium tumefaciens TaxID=358 RepID=UPI00129B6073|nr:hypothetical protein [Agrobacterium tumefaciens]MRH96237.1 hypothetical protein [Agrobacterium tumefaciens]